MSRDRATLVARIEAFLDAHHVMTLATRGESGAHAASLMYARRGLTLHWTSDPGTRHSRELEAEARVSSTVAPDYADFRSIVGVQIEGSAERIRDAREAQAARDLLAQRYAFLAEVASGPPALRAALDKAACYRFVPLRITLIDNTRGFGHKEVLELER
jgi:uncharacterized protein YhbP (UPF0306 family)